MLNNRTMVAPQGDLIINDTESMSQVIENINYEANSQWVQELQQNNLLNNEPMTWAWDKNISQQVGDKVPVLYVDPYTGIIRPLLVLKATMQRHIFAKRCAEGGMFFGNSGLPLMAQVCPDMNVYDWAMSEHEGRMNEAMENQLDAITEQIREKHPRGFEWALNMAQLQYADVAVIIHNALGKDSFVQRRINVFNSAMAHLGRNERADANCAEVYQFEDVLGLQELSQYASDVPTGSVSSSAGVASSINMSRANLSNGGSTITNISKDSFLNASVEQMEKYIVDTAGCVILDHLPDMDADDVFEFLDSGNKLEDYTDRNGDKVFVNLASKTASAARHTNIDVNADQSQIKNQTRNFSVMSEGRVLSQPEMSSPPRLQMSAHQAKVMANGHNFVKESNPSLESNQLQRVLQEKFESLLEVGAVDLDYDEQVEYDEFKAEAEKAYMAAQGESQQVIAENTALAQEGSLRRDGKTDQEVADDLNKFIASKQGESAQPKSFEINSNIGGHDVEALMAELDAEDEVETGIYGSLTDDAPVSKDILSEFNFAGDMDGDVEDCELDYTVFGTDGMDNALDNMRGFGMKEFQVVPTSSMDVDVDNVEFISPRVLLGDSEYVLWVLVNPTTAIPAWEVHRASVLPAIGSRISDVVSYDQNVMTPLVTCRGNKVVEILVSKEDLANCVAELENGNMGALISIDGEGGFADTIKDSALPVIIDEEDEVIKEKRIIEGTTDEVALTVASLSAGAPVIPIWDTKTAVEVVGEIDPEIYNQVKEHGNGREGAVLWDNIISTLVKNGDVVSARKLDSMFTSYVNQFLLKEFDTGFEKIDCSFMDTEDFVALINAIKEDHEDGESLVKKMHRLITRDMFETIDTIYCETVEVMGAPDCQAYDLPANQVDDLTNEEGNYVTTRTVIKMRHPMIDLAHLDSVLTNGELLGNTSLEASVLKKVFEFCGKRDNPELDTGSVLVNCVDGTTKRAIISRSRIDGERVFMVDYK